MACSVFRWRPDERDVQQTGWREVMDHGLVNYIDTKAKCRHLKNWPVKGLCGRCSSEFIGFVNCFPSNLLFGSTLPPPHPCVNKYNVYSCTECKGEGGYGVLGLRQINTCRKVPFTDQFFKMTTFRISYYESYLSTPWTQKKYFNGWKGGLSVV